MRQKQTVKNTDNTFEHINANESDYLYVRDSQIPGSGNGLYTAIDIYKGEIIARFSGELLSRAEAAKRANEGNDAYFISMLNGFTMDSMYTNCFAKYANDANGFVKTTHKSNTAIALDENENVCLVATCKIISGNEIFCNYGKKYWKKNAKK